MTFEPFSPAHWAAILFTAAVVVAIVGFRARLRGVAADRAFRIGLAALLIGSEISLYAWYTIEGMWGYFALPFQLCTMMVWASAAMLLTKSRKLYEIAFFLGILGALQALLTPNLEQTFPHFRYFHFFIAHAAIIGSSVYMTAAAGYRPTFRAMLRAFGWLNIFALAASIVNWATGENFMFLARKPDTASLLDLLAPWPWYIAELEAVAAALCLALLGLIKLVDRLTNGRPADRS